MTTSKTCVDYRMAVIILLQTLVIGQQLQADSPSDPSPSEVSYHRDIRPIFQSKCHGCHQPAKQGGEYEMTSMARLLRGGESGDPAIVPGNPDASYLIEMITPMDGHAEMPKDSDPLNANEVSRIRSWITAGAIDDAPAKSSRFDDAHPPQYVRLPAITSLDFSPNGKLLAVPGFHEVALFQADGTDRIARLIGMSPRIEAVRFSPNGKKLAVAGGRPAEMGEVQIWDVATFQLQRSVMVTSDTVRGVSWSDDSRWLAFGCSDNTVRAIDVKTGEFVLRQGSHTDWVLATTFAKDANHLVSVSRDMSCKLVDLRKQQLVDNITSVADGALQGGIHCIVRHPFRDEVLFGGADGVPKIYKIFRTAKRKRDGDENLLWRLPPIPGRIFGIDIGADGRLIAIGSSLNAFGTVHLHRLDETRKIPADIQTILETPPRVRKAEQESRLKEHFRRGVHTITETRISDSGIFAVAIHPHGDGVAVGGSDGHVRFIDAANGNIIGRFAPFHVEDDSRVKSRTPTASTETDASEPIPPAVASSGQPIEVAKLDVLPTSLRFNSSVDYAQMIVTAKLDSGDTLDVTRMAHMVPTSNLIRISKAGMVTPIADGATNLVISHKGQSTTIPVRVTSISQPLHPDFKRDVAPVFSRLGCNSGKCHGSRSGKKGFKLSLRGYDPVSDVRALTDDLYGRRVNLALPRASLMLTKPTAAVPHEGGQLLQTEDHYYKIIHAWIKDGARLERDSNRVARVDVYPVNPVLPRIGDRQQLRVVATYQDGAQRDVTKESFIESGNSKVARMIDGQIGLMASVRRGETPILVRYEGAYAATTLTVMGDRRGFVWQPQESNNQIDDFVWKKLKRTKTLPSPLCEDHEFVRRVYLDLTGLPPTIPEIHGFIHAKGDSKNRRDALIDRLVGSTEYIEFRANKWADLLQVNGKYLGREGATRFRKWIRDEIAHNTPYDQFVRKILTSRGSNKQNPAASYYKILRDPQDLMANTTQLFLATRFTCNECHDHPFERWTQDNFYQMSAWFAQVGFKKDEASGDKKIKTSATEPAHPLFEIVYDKQEGEVIHQRTFEVAKPAFPFDCDCQAPPDATRCEQLAAWITSPDNAYFAKSYVNRIWGYLTGRALIEPIDDIRAGNPPTNPDLLDFLTRQFINSGFDERHLIRMICKSRVYQLSTQVDRWNEDDDINYSHAVPRRLPAEVVYDAIYRTTGATSAFPGVPKGTRAAALPDVGIKLPDEFLSKMGRPARESSCECERSEELELGVVLALVNSPTVSKAIGDNNNAIGQLAAEPITNRELVEKMFLRFLNRPGTEKEVAAGLQVFETIEYQHQQLAKKLAALERSLEPQRIEQEKRRLAELGEAKRAFAEYQKRQAPKRSEAERKRQQKIAETQAALTAYEKQLPTRLRAWERENQNTTSWTVLNPVEMTADTPRTVLSLQADHSIIVSGAHGPGAIRLMAETKLKNMTGIRIDALRDNRLDLQGPRRAMRNFVLTELEVERAALNDDATSVLARWEFDQDPGSWQPMSNNALTVKNGRLSVQSKGAYPAMATRVTASAGLFALEIVAKINRQAMMRIYWSTVGMRDFDKARSHRHGVMAGDTPWRRYRFHFKTHEDLTGIRLDLDKKNGKVEVDSIRLLKLSSDFQRVSLKNPQADFSKPGFEVGHAIDGDLSDDQGWSIPSQVSQNHVAIFESNEFVTDDSQSLIRVTLHQNFRGGPHSLGRFRISLTNSVQPLTFGLPQPISEIVRIPGSERSPQQQKALIEFFRTNDKRFRQLESALTDANSPLPDDPLVEQHQQKINQLSRPLPVNPELSELRQNFAISQQQLANKRLTAAQDLAWAFINKPEFLYNH